MVSGQFLWLESPAVGYSVGLTAGLVSATSTVRELPALVQNTWQQGKAAAAVTQLAMAHSAPSRIKCIIL